MFPSFSFLGGFPPQILVYYNLKSEAPSFLGRELGNTILPFFWKDTKTFSKSFTSWLSTMTQLNWSLIEHLKLLVVRSWKGRYTHSTHIVPQRIHWKFGLWWNVNAMNACMHAWRNYNVCGQPSFIQWEGSSLSKCSLLN